MFDSGKIFEYLWCQPSKRVCRGDIICSTQQIDWISNDKRTHSLRGASSVKSLSQHIPEGYVIRSLLLSVHVGILKCLCSDISKKPYGNQMDLWLWSNRYDITVRHWASSASSFDRFIPSFIMANFHVEIMTGSRIHALYLHVPYAYTHLSV